MIIGIGTIVLIAYEPFSSTFDWGLADGWEFWWWQRYVVWLMVIVGWPVLLPKDIYSKFTERKNVREWKKTGSYIDKIK